MVLLLFHPVEDLKRQNEFSIYCQISKIPSKYTQSFISCSYERSVVSIIGISALLFDDLTLLLKEPQLITVLAKVIRNTIFTNDFKLKYKIHSNHKWRMIT